MSKDCLCDEHFCGEQWNCHQEWSRSCDLKYSWSLSPIRHGRDLTFLDRTVVGDHVMRRNEEVFQALALSPLPPETTLKMVITAINLRRRISLYMLVSLTIVAEGAITRRAGVAYVFPSSCYLCSHRCYHHADAPSPLVSELPPKEGTSHLMGDSPAASLPLLHTLPCRWEKCEDEKEEGAIVAADCAPSLKGNMVSGYSKRTLDVTTDISLLNWSGLASRRPNSAVID